MRRGKLIRRILWSVLGILTILVVWNWELVSYGYRQAKGQLHIVWNAEPIETFLNDPSFPDSLKVKLRFIQTVRQYAIDSLGLNDTDNYKTMFDQRGEEVMWVVTASEPFALKAKLWEFPVLGAVPYKGFFEKERALQEREQLVKEGWDVSVRNPGGWSTLGWFTDPILSGMLDRSEGDLASLIIHEMSHATIFVKDSIDFNENLASFIGDRGAEKFLRDTYGDTSRFYQHYLEEDREYIRYAAHVLRACNYLDSLYTAIGSWPVEKKKAEKAKAMKLFVESMDTLTFTVLRNPRQNFEKRMPNNAYFLSYRRYQSKQDIFFDQWRGRFQGDLRAYIRWLRETHPFL
jgi:predicted aminopeptidase